MENGSNGASVNMGDYPLRDITTPHPHDVLCGRGGGTNNHIGNSHWRMLVAANKQLYITLPKRQKMLLSRSIVHAVRSQNPAGRFLQKEPKCDKWYDIGDQRAQEKTSQALREGAPDLRSKMSKTPKGGESDCEIVPSSSPDRPPSAAPPSAGVSSTSTNKTKINSKNKNKIKEENNNSNSTLEQQQLLRADSDAPSVSVSVSVGGDKNTATSSLPTPPDQLQSPTTSGIVSSQPGSPNIAALVTPGMVPPRMHNGTGIPPPIPPHMSGVPGRSNVHPGLVTSAFPPPMQGRHSTAPPMMPPGMPHPMHHIPPPTSNIPTSAATGPPYYPSPNVPMQMVPAMIMNEKGMLVQVMSYVPQMPAPVPTQGSFQQQHQQHQQHHHHHQQQQQNKKLQRQQQESLNIANNQQSQPQLLDDRELQNQQIPNRNAHQRKQPQRQPQNSTTGDLPRFESKLSKLYRDESFEDQVDAVLPPEGLDMNSVSFGSINFGDEAYMRQSVGDISLTAEEQKQLMTSLEGGTGMSFGSTMSYAKVNNNAKPTKLSDKNSNSNTNNSKNAPADDKHNKAVASGRTAGATETGDVVPAAVDGGLEPTGISFGSVFSAMSVEDKRLEETGISFGSMMSFRPEQVDGGLDAIGTSFGSMSIDQQRNQYGAGPSILPPLPSGNNGSFSDKDQVLPPTLMGSSRATDNLLDCSDTESESEGETEKLKSQKSEAWEKMMGTFVASKSGHGDSLLRSIGNSSSSATDQQSFQLNPRNYSKDNSGGNYYNNGANNTNSNNYSQAQHYHQMATLNNFGSQADHYQHMAALNNFGGDEQFIVPGAVGETKGDTANENTTNTTATTNASTAEKTDGISRRESGEEMPPPPPAMKKSNSDSWDDKIDLMYNLDRGDSSLALSDLGE